MVRRKIFREKKKTHTTLPFPQSCQILAAEAFFSTKQEGFVPSKRLLSAAARDPGRRKPPLGGWHVSSHKSLSWQPLLRKPALSRTSPVTKDNVAKPEAHSVPQRDRGLSLFWCQLAGLVERSPVEQMWPGYIMQIGCSEELISECL